MLERATRAPSRYPDIVLVEIDGTAHAAVCAQRAVNQHGPARVRLVVGKIGERWRDIATYAEYLQSALECDLVTLDASTRNFMHPYATDLGLKMKVCVCVHWTELPPASDAPGGYTRSYPMIGVTLVQMQRFLHNHKIKWPEIFDAEPEVTGPPPDQMMPLRRRRAAPDADAANVPKEAAADALPMRRRTQTPAETETPSAAKPLRRRVRPIVEQKGFFE